MPDPTHTGQQRVELYVRADLPEPTRGRLAAISHRLDSLVADGQLASYTTTTWAKRTQVSTDGEQYSQYVSFLEWARSAGVELSPAFETRRCYSMETGECAEWLIYPVVCMAVYDDDDQLAAVYPHDGEQPRSVFDALDSLDTTAHQPLDAALGSSVSD
ncbi:MAG: HTH domain-containing protein [Halapricum sp.]